jgi:hypothetical protein
VRAAICVQIDTAYRNQDKTFSTCYSGLAPLPFASLSLFQYSSNASSHLINNQPIDLKQLLYLGIALAISSTAKLEPTSEPANRLRHLQRMSLNNEELI